jgi:NAD(P)-dependent dehydrogenase (short-subunit alcohol dehydrogenase family)
MTATPPPGPTGATDATGPTGATASAGGGPSTWFITGGSPGGFGIAFAEAALDAGDRVVLTARRTQPLTAWATAYERRARVLTLDVTRPDHVRAAVAAAESEFGGIDVLVNNAGRGWSGSVEGMDESMVRSTFELNFFAVATVIRAVLPGMRARRRGWIVNMSSTAGMHGVVGFGYYSAAKHALEGLTATLRREVAEFGIQVLAVEPGAFRTQAYAGFADEPVREAIRDYHPMLNAVRDTMTSQHGRQPGDPRRGVRAVLRAMRQDPPPERLVLGGAAFDSVTATLRDTLADIRSTEALARGADFRTRLGEPVSSQSPR